MKSVKKSDTPSDNKHDSKVAQEDDKDKSSNSESGELVFPQKVQICYGSSINLCEIAHMDMLGDHDKGYLEEYEGVEFLMDPESFVDPGYSLTRKVT